MLKNRLLAIGVTLLFAGTAIIVFTSGTFVTLCVAAVFVLCIILCTVRFLRQPLKYALIFAAIPLIGLVYAAVYRNLFVLPYSAFDLKNDTVTAEVISLTSSGFDASVVSDTVGLPKGTVIRVYSDCHPVCGDRVAFTGKLRYAGERQSVLSAGAKLFCTSYDVSVTPGEGPLYDFRVKAYAAFDNLPEKYASFLKAIIFNDKSFISEPRYAMYRNSGAAAYFSVSGLHVSFIAMAIYNILIYFRVRSIVRSAASIGVALLYGALAGFTPSVTRAVIMLIFVVAARLLYTESDSVTSLFFALGVLMLQNPFSLASLSLQLSFLATLGALYILAIIKPVEKKHRVKHALTGIFVIPVLTSAACFIFTLPVSLFSFDVVSLTSPLTNIALSLIFIPLLFLAFPAAAISLFTPQLPAILKYPLMVLINAFDMVCDFFSSTIKLLLPTGSAFAVAAFVISLIAVIFALLGVKKLRRVAFYTSCALVFVTLTAGIIVQAVKTDGDCRIAYSQGYRGYSVIALCDGEAVYIDCGDGFDDAFVYSQQLTSVDTYIVNAYSDSTAAGIEYAALRFGLKKIVVLAHDADDYRSQLLMTTAVENGCTIEFVSIYTLGTDTLGILCERDITYLYSNSSAFVIADGSAASAIAAYDGVYVGSVPEAALVYGIRIYISDGASVPEYANSEVCRLSYGQSVSARYNGNDIEVILNEP